MTCGSKREGNEVAAQGHGGSKPLPAPLPPPMGHLLERDISSREGRPGRGLLQRDISSREGGARSGLTSPGADSLTVTPRAQRGGRVTLPNTAKVEITTPTLTTEIPPLPTKHAALPTDESPRNPVTAPRPPQQMRKKKAAGDTLESSRMARSLPVDIGRTAQTARGASSAAATAISPSGPSVQPHSARVLRDTTTGFSSNHNDLTSEGDDEDDEEFSELRPYRMPHTPPETPTKFFDSIAKLSQPKVFLHRRLEAEREKAPPKPVQLPTLKQDDKKGWYNQGRKVTALEYTEDDCIERDEHDKARSLHLPNIGRTEKSGEYIRKRIRFLKKSDEALELFDEQCSAMQKERDHNHLVEQNQRAAELKTRLEASRQEGQRRRQKLIELNMSRSMDKSMMSNSHGRSIRSSRSTSNHSSSRKSHSRKQHRQLVSDTDDDLGEASPLIPKTQGDGSAVYPHPPPLQGLSTLQVAHAGSEVDESSRSEVSGFLTATTLETHTHQEPGALAGQGQSQSPKESPSRRGRSISRRLTGTKVHLEGSSFTIGDDDDGTGKPQVLFTIGTIGKRQAVASSREGLTVGNGTVAIPPLHPLCTPQYLQHLENARDSVRQSEDKLEAGDKKRTQAAMTKQTRANLLAAQRQWLRVMQLARSMRLFWNMANPHRRKMKGRGAMLLAACCAGRWVQLTQRTRHRRGQLLVNCILRKYLPAIVARHRHKKYGPPVDQIKVFLGHLKTVFHFPRAINRFAKGVRSAQRIVLRHLYARRLWRAAMLLAWEQQAERDLKDYLLLKSSTDDGGAFSEFADDSKMRRRLRDFQNEIRTQGRIRNEEYMEHGDAANVPILMFVPFEYRVAVVNNFCTKWTHAMIRGLIERDEKKRRGEWVDPDVDPADEEDEEDANGGVQGGGDSQDPFVVSVLAPDGNPTSGPNSKPGTSASGSKPGLSRGSSSKPSKSPLKRSNSHSRSFSRGMSMSGEAADAVNADTRAARRSTKNQIHKSLMEKANPNLHNSREIAAKRSFKSSTDVVNALRNQNMNHRQSLRILKQNREQQQEYLKCILGSDFGADGKKQQGGSSSIADLLSLSNAGSPTASVMDSSMLVPFASSVNPDAVNTSDNLQTFSAPQRKPKVKLPGRMWIRKGDITKLVRYTQRAILKHQLNCREERIQERGVGHPGFDNPGDVLGVVSSQVRSLGEAVLGQVDISGTATDSIRAAIISGVLAKNHEVSVQQADRAFRITSKGAIAQRRQQLSSDSGPDRSRDTPLVHTIPEATSHVTALEMAAFLAVVTNFSDEAGLDEVPPPLDAEDVQAHLLQHPRVGLNEVTTLYPELIVTVSRSQAGTPDRRFRKKGPDAIPPFLEIPKESFSFMDNMIEIEVQKMLYSRRREVSFTKPSGPAAGGTAAQSSTAATGLQRQSSLAVIKKGNRAK